MKTASPGARDPRAVRLPVRTGSRPSASLTLGLPPANAVPLCAGERGGAELHAYRANRLLCQPCRVELKMKSIAQRPAEESTHGTVDLFSSRVGIMSRSIV